MKKALKRAIIGMVFFILLVYILPVTIEGGVKYSRILLKKHIYASGQSLSWPYIICLLRAILFRALILGGILYGAYYFLKRWLPSYNKAKEQYFKVTIVLVFSTIIIVLLCEKEVSLRVQGYSPGWAYSGVKQVDSLVVEYPVVCDSIGMNSLNPKYYSVHDSSHHVNLQGGFCNIDYTQAVADSLHRKGKRIVFILGDSFVQGVSDHYDSTFVEQLKQDEDYLVWPLGVGGTEALNYELAVRNYIHLLKPGDVVFTVFCYNDLTLYDRLPTPGIPIAWSTNVGGWMWSPIPYQFSGRTDSVIANPQQAYEYVLARASLFKKTDLLSRICRKWRVTTQIYYKFFPLKLFPVDCNKPMDDGPLKHLTRIDSMCCKTNIALQIIFIPDPQRVDRIKTRDQFENEYRKELKQMLQKIYYPFGFSFQEKSDYISLQNQHFNDRGNSKIVPVIDSLIRTKINRDYNNHLIND